MKIWKQSMVGALVLLLLSAVACAPAGDGDGSGDGQGLSDYTGSAGSGGGGLFGRDAFNDAQQPEAGGDSTDDRDNDTDTNNDDTPIAENNSTGSTNNEDVRDNEDEGEVTTPETQETLGSLSQEEQQALCDSLSHNLEQIVGEESFVETYCLLIGISVEEDGAGSCEDFSDACMESPEDYSASTSQYAEYCPLVGSSCDVPVEDVEICLDALVESWNDLVFNVDCTSGQIALDATRPSKLSDCQPVVEACPDLF